MLAIVKRFEDLKAWQGCRFLTKRIYMITEPLMTDRKYSLADQMRRAAVSAMSNIAEGFARYNVKEFIHFLNMAQSSLSELKSQAYIVLDLKILTDADFESLSDEIDLCRNRILGLLKYLKNRKSDGVSDVEVFYDASEANELQ